jgi:hypothetical protein
MSRIHKKHVLPLPGSKFIRSWKGIEYEMTVIKEGNTYEYKVNNELFSSPSGAARFITKQNVNGWRFWKIELK